MIIGIMSDSHGDALAIQKAAEALPQAECWLHAGDFYADSEYLAKITGKKVYGVAGNCDGFGFLRQVEPDKLEKFIELAGWKIWLQHGHRYDVKSGTDDLIEDAVQIGMDIVVYGHTHVVDNRQQEKLLVLNPGSVTRPSYMEPPTCMRLELTKNAAVAEIIRLA